MKNEYIMIILFLSIVSLALNMYELKKESYTDIRMTPI